MLYHLFLAVHIGAGSLALLGGPAALAVAKGGRAHGLIGRGFYWAMLVVAATSLVLAVIKSSSFLFAVGIFSAYLNLTGTAVLRRKQRGQLHQTGASEWALAGLMALACLYFGGYGVYLLLHGNLFGLVFVAFALSTQRMVRQDWALLRQRGLTPTTWLSIHITRMVGTCIAAYTKLGCWAGFCRACWGHPLSSTGCAGCGGGRPGRWRWQRRVALVSFWPARLCARPRAVSGGPRR